MPFLASDVMDSARGILNDVGASLYTNTAQTPYVIKANEELEQELLMVGVETNLKVSAAIVVAANATTVTLPSDFLLPINLFERASGNTNDPWTRITEKVWNPADYVPGTTLTYWAFQSNVINFPGATTARDVLIQYARQLAVITGPNSPEDFGLSKRFLSAKTAELCARFVGMNKTFSDEIALREVEPARDAICRIFVLNGQGISRRRIRFTTRRPGDFYVR